MVYEQFTKYLKLIPFVPQKDILSAAKISWFKTSFQAFLPNRYLARSYIVSENLPRSNNSIEAWHKAFSQDIHSHPETNRLINHFLKEQHLMEICLEQIKHGVVFPRDPREVKKDLAINCVSSNFNKTEYLDYFNKLIKLLKN
ncbi:hypothetical protein BpHYR1_048974 [Brachionus plicatilis]|uniref:Uncharacterized protein n=1 Tax=Brachionus plicatilis TaxID=10195 RepID=A0A3M7RVP2_BRAPC|nr:hypothetical protein BpHYR1_048974 [Brachionus plicatilis]